MVLVGPRLVLAPAALGSSGFVGLSWFGLRLVLVLAAAVVSLTLVSGCVRCLFWSLGVSGGEGSGVIITKESI